MSKRSNGEGTIYKRKNGTWCASYYFTTPQGKKRKSVYGKTQKEVREKLKKAQRDVEQQSVTNDRKIALSDWVAIWLKEYKRNKRIGRVYQNPSMGTCPSMTILENMALADNKGKLYGLGRGTNKARIEYYREQLAQLGLGLEDKMDVKVGSLSGGQRQAMALLMSTMTPIEFLILDEHTAALDPKTAELIMQLTDKIVKEKQLTTIMVTHNLRYAVEYGNRLVMMHNGHMILDKKGKEKEDMAIDDILTLFNEISIECGN